jgi:hypothetical protein
MDIQTIVTYGISYVENELINWRAYNFNSNGDMILVTRDMVIIKIQNISTELFEETLQKQPEALLENSSFIGISAACCECAGNGYRDWITKATKPEAPTPTLELDNFNYIIDNTIKKRKFKRGTITYYLSTQKINSPFELCDNCKGTGMHLFSNQYNQI